MDDRITINEFDYSTSPTPVTSYSVGCTVIKAPKGPKTPVLIQAGDLNTFRDLFGSSKLAPALYRRDLYEAETYLRNYSCYISAPYTKASSASTLEVGAIKVAANGTASLVSNFTWDESYETLEGLSEITPPNDCAFMIIPQSPRASGKMVFSITPNTSKASVLDRFTITCYEEDAYHDSSKKYSIDIRLTEGSKNASESFIDLSPNNLPYASNNLFWIIKGSQSLTASPSLSEENGTLTFSGREFSSYNAGWDEVKGDSSIGKSVDVIFSVEDHADTSSTFFSLANDGDFRQSCYLFSLSPSSLEPVDIPSLDNIGDQDKRYYNICGQGFTTTEGNIIKTNFMGSRAVMQSRINEGKLGGWAPMYLNQGGMGGQLGVNVSKMCVKYTKKNISDLKKAHYNPIIKDPTYGVMIVAQNTCQSGETNDWSYIGHSASFIIFEKACRRLVMEPQIGKPINPYYENLRATQVQRLLDTRCSGDDRIWAAGIVDTSESAGVNDATNKAERNFIINVKVKVDVFSEGVTLNFTNVGQDVEITE